MAFTKTAGVNYGDPDFTLTTANASGSNQVAVRNDASLLVYDTTDPTTIAYSDSASPGDSSTAARRNHVHGMVADPTVASASDAEMETGTATDVYVSPGRQQLHQSAAKVWAFMSASGGNTASYNVTSTTRNTSGDFTITIATDFGSASYAVCTTPISNAAHRVANIGSQAVGTVGVFTWLDNSADSCATGTVMFGSQ